MRRRPHRVLGTWRAAVILGSLTLVAACQSGSEDPGSPRSLDSPRQKSAFRDIGKRSASDLTLE